ncbi:succinylglutamate desuccinylase [Halomonas sp. WWR20]
MLDDWLALTLEDATPARRGRVPGGHYALRAPGILELIPERPTEHARACVISIGIHGNETAPIELVGELLARLEAGLIRLGAPVLVILGNPPALRAGKRFCETNLNRLFRREPNATDAPPGDEPARARELMAAVDAFYAGQQLPRLHYDLHTAIRDSRYPRFAVEPFAATATESEQWCWLAAADMQAVLHQHQPSWTFSHYSKHYHAAQAFTLELGKVQPFGDNDLTALRPMSRLLAALIEGRRPPEAAPESLTFFRVAVELMREAEDFRLCFADDTPNFTEFPVGTRLAEDAQAGDFIVREAPLAVVFPNAQVELGARAALLVRPSTPPPPTPPGEN